MTFLITVLNGGPGAATNVALTDTLPGEVQFLSATSSQGTCTGTATVVCTFGDVANGAAVTVSVSLQVLATAVGPLTNNAVVEGDRDPNPANDTAVTTTPVAAVPPPSLP